MSMDANEGYVRSKWAHVSSYEYRGLPNIAVKISANIYLTNQSRKRMIRGAGVCLDPC